MADKCKRCGACKECGAAPPIYPTAPVYVYPTWWVQPYTYPRVTWNQQGSVTPATYSSSAATGTNVYWTNCG